MAYKKTEQMTEANIQHVIDQLSADKPWSKKDCCAFLGMAYNTTRLATILEDFSKTKEHEKKQYAAKKRKPASKEEIATIISSYLEGDTMECIAKNIFRSAGFVKNILVKNDVPFRPAATNYLKPELIPEAAIREDFDVGEVVYSTRYNTNAVIREEAKATPKNKLHGKVYKIWLLGDNYSYFAYQAAYDLASLRHLTDKMAV